MTHEKILKRPDGSRIKIEASIFVDHHGNNAVYWSYGVYYCEEGKRKFINWNYDKKEPVTPAEIHAAKLELWEKLKPE